MSKKEKEIQNHINLFLAISQNSDNSYSYKYLCRMDNGVEVNLAGLVISQPTKITVELTSQTNDGYIITECLIPCDQKTVTATINSADDKRTVTLIDRDNERIPEDYNFIIIARNRHTNAQIVCDPQVQNKGTI